MTDRDHLPADALLPAGARIIAGPAGSGKTDALLAEHRRALLAGPIGCALWISPNHRSAAEVRAQLLTGDFHGCLRPGVMTFAQFAEQVLAASEIAVQPITGLVKRQIVRRLILSRAAAGKLKHFAPIAGTAGLTDLVCELISEFKTQEIWPEEFQTACNSRGMSPKDRDVLALYMDYQNHLTQQNLYDAEGRFWIAREQLKAGARPPFAALRSVIIDGFADFTRPQHEILETLAGRVERLLISLPVEIEEGRGDLFAKPRQTLAVLTKLRPAPGVQNLPRRVRADWPTSSHIETELFKSPRHVKPAAVVARVEIIEAARAIDEINLVGRRIKRLLVEGDPDDGRHVAPGDVTVVLRSPAAMASLVAEVFDDLGLPYVLPDGRPLAKSPALAALISLIRLHVDDWPYRSLSTLLSHNYFQPAWPSWQNGQVAAAVDGVLRALQVPHGRGALLSAVEHAARQSGDENADAVATLPLLRNLAEALDRLPAEATSADWAQAIAALGAEIGVQRGIDSSPEPLAKTDRAAWDLLIQSLAASERFATPQGAAADRYDADQLLDLLLDILRSETLPERMDEVGRVKVLSPTSARALSIPYLFVAGLSEQSFPAPPRGDRLYSEAEYERLAAAGLPVALRAQRSQEEMLLFYEVLTRATRRLCLSYPGLDEKAQPLLPSPYLIELEQALGGSARHFQLDDLSPIPRDEPPTNPTDERVLAVARALELRESQSTTDTLGVFAQLAARKDGRPISENVIAGIEAMDSRSARDAYGPFDGMLTSDAARGTLAKKFNEETLWSASRLEQYRGCPYKFFLQNVLRLAPLDTLTLETDNRNRGSRLHDVLARAHQALNQSTGQPTSPSAAAAAAIFRKSVDDTLAENQAKPGALPHQPALDEIDRRVLVAWLTEYLLQHADYDKLWGDFDTTPAPAHFEVSFGQTRKSDDPLSTVMPLELTSGEKTVKLQGRIDRIDLGTIAGAPVLSVLDYKSGSVRRHTLQAIASGDDLQVTIYALAAERLLARSGHTPWQAGYWSVADGGFRAKHALSISELTAGKALPTLEWKQLREEIEALVVRLVDGIRDGQFPVASRNDECTSYCEYSTVCRINHVRSLEKTWDLPTVLR